MKDKIKGCIVGLGCGDALGAPVEFMNQTALIQQYGPGGVRDLGESYGVRGAYTDDTQMTLATAEGVVAAREAECDRVSVDPGPYIYQAYIEWRLSQINPDNCRGPGNTCLGSLSSGVAGSVARSINDSKGCGGVMRVAPVGLVYDRAKAWLYGCESAALTHGHPGGYLPAGFMAVMLSHVLLLHERDGDRHPRAVLEESFNEAMEFLEDVKDAYEARMASDARWMEKRDHFASLMVNARSLADQKKWTDEMVMRKLGAGWCGDEALAMSVFCALRHPSHFEDAVVTAVNYSGDRDSVGCITGALMGALRGFDSIPKRWVEAVENRELLETTAERLSEVSVHRG